MRTVRSSSRLSGGSASVHAGIPTPGTMQPPPPGIMPPLHHAPPREGVKQIPLMWEKCTHAKDHWIPRTARLPSSSYSL